MVGHSDARETEYLLVDANMGWTLAEAQRWARAMEALNLFWIEEPLIPEDVAGHAALARATATPVVAGENLYTRDQLA